MSKIKKIIALMLLIYWCITVNAQSNKSFHIRGIIVNSLKLKPIRLSLLDSNRKVLEVINSDSAGGFKFNSSLPSGRYYISNKKYKVDTSFLTKNVILEPFLLDLNHCEIDAKQAELDIKHGQAKLLLIGGIAPVYYAGQEAFQKMFSVQYYDFGCTPASDKCVLEYNRAIFTHLDKVYGKRWRSLVRKDVIGLK